MEENRYLYRQVFPTTTKPIFAAGAMLEVTNAFSVLTLLDAAEKEGLDIMSAGVALAWATEAVEKGVVSTRETIVPLKFGDMAAYREAFHHLGAASNDFYRLLGQGAMKARGALWGGLSSPACSARRWQATPPVRRFFVSQALGFRHSHLDAGGYAYDQKNKPPDVKGAVEFLVQDERARVLLTSLVSCLFARGVYGEELIAECLRSIGSTALADRLGTVSDHVQRLRWRLRLGNGLRSAHRLHTATLPGNRDVEGEDRYRLSHSDEGRLRGGHPGPGPGRLRGRTFAAYVAGVGDCCLGQGASRGVIS